MELWDAYDANFHEVKDVTLIRGEPIPDGLFHLVCDVIVKHADGDYLLMQRDSQKHYGGMWEATAGGSALRGESPPDCAVRELREETGINAKQLVELGRVVSEQNRTLYVEFSCVTDQPKDSVTLQKGETSDYKWVGKDELIHMKKSELVTERIQRFVKELQKAAEA